MGFKQRLRKSKRLHHALILARQAGGRCLMRLFHALGGVDRRTVLFSSYVGRLYGDNPRYVSEALHRLRPDLRIVWQLRRGASRADVPDYVSVVPARSLRSLWRYSTAGAFVDNMNRPQYMLKFPGQVYVQTWHGDRGFKRIMRDMGTNEPFPDGGQMDLAVSGSDFGSRVYRSAFGYGGEILECGCPRNDLLLQNPPEIAARVRQALNIPEGTRVLLYAPTFRDAAAGQRQTAPLSLQRVRERLEESTGARWLCLTRGHEQNRGIDSDAARDVSDYPEVGELLLAVDMLVSDYSSIGGDFMLLGRPAIYFHPDKADYLRERALYFDPDDSPLTVAHSEEELLELICRPVDWAANCREALAFFGVHESGHAAEAVAARIVQLLEAAGK